MKRNFIKFAVLGLCIIAITNTTKAQRQNNIPEKGSSSIGIVINPISGIRANGMFKAGDFIGNAIQAQAASPYQMFILADPLISLRYKYKMSNTTSFRGSIGFSGAKFNYKEYIQDDIAALDAAMDGEFTAAQVEDIIHFKMSGGGLNLGLEFGGNAGNFRFTGGFGLVYSFGGGSTSFTYGNQMTSDNLYQPTIMPIIDSLKMSGFYKDINLAGARPVKRYPSGVEHAFGLSLDLGLEWYFAKNISIGATVSLVPFIYAIQPETYIESEGYSPVEDAVMKVKKKISSGSNYLLYGTENIGLQLSFNYYF